MYGREEGITMAVREIEQLFAAIQSGDHAAIERLTSPDLTYRLAGSSRFAGVHAGRDRVLAMIAELNTVTGMTTTVEAVYDGPDAAIVHQRGAAGDYRDEALLRFAVKDGRVTDVTEFLFDVAAFDALVAGLSPAKA
jgi:ketosteroid isomerase-like protein